MFEHINEVEYAHYGSDVWERLEIMGLGFTNMGKAIEFVRENVKHHGMTSGVRLRLKNGGSVEEWDNF